MVPILSLALGVEKRRGKEKPVEVLRVEWTGGEAPRPSELFEAIEEAYASIEPPYFPSIVYAIVTTAKRREVVACGEPVDALHSVGIALWNGIVVATTGSG